MGSVKSAHQKSPGKQIPAGLCLPWGRTLEATDPASAVCERLIMPSCSHLGVKASLCIQYCWYGRMLKFQAWSASKPLV